MNRWAIKQWTGTWPSSVMAKELRLPATMLETRMCDNASMQHTWSLLSNPPSPNCPSSPAPLKKQSAHPSLAIPYYHPHHHHTFYDVGSPPNMLQKHMDNEWRRGTEREFFLTSLLQQAVPSSAPPSLLHHPALLFFSTPLLPLHRKWELPNVA